jgi:Trehalose synthase, N-terminal domain
LPGAQQRGVQHRALACPVIGQTERPAEWELDPGDPRRADGGGELRDLRQRYRRDAAGFDDLLDQSDRSAADRSNGHQHGGVLRFFCRHENVHFYATHSADVDGELAKLDADGCGVAEMLQVLVGYVQDLDIPIGWLVITGDAGFFAITKRLHNQIHGRRSGAPLGAAEARHYGQMLAANAVELVAGSGSVMWCCCMTRRPPDWPRRWRRRARGWCGAATSGWTGKTT